MSLFAKKEVPEITLDAWVLCGVDREPRSYSDANECHAGRVKFHDGKGNYAVRFWFGTRWVARKRMDVVDEARARFVEPHDTESLLDDTRLQLKRISRGE